MEKAIFSITCTTCRARLAVRSEAAIGTILECPRCQSMVQVTPPPGWQPEPPPVSLPPVGAGPPPLDRVAIDPLALDLEQPDTALPRWKWLVRIAVPMATVVAITATVWLLVVRGENEPPVVETEPSAVASARTEPTSVTDAPESLSPLRDVAQKKVERPATEPAGVKEDAPATSVEPPSRSVSSEPMPAQPPSTQPARTSDAKPPQPDPFGPVAAEAKELPPVEIKKSPPAQVDAAARLDDPVAEIHWIDMPLVKAIDLLATMSALPVTIDADAMMQLGISLREPISLQLSSTTLGKAMQAAVAQKGLAMTVEGGQVLIGAPAEYRETLRTVRYTVADLTGSEKAATAELAALVRKLVAPESWQPSGGRGTIEADQSVLIVKQSGDVHEQVLVFCEKLRNARHKPLRSRENPERFALATRCDQARKLLDRPVTANFHDPAPLANILTFLADATGADILVDRAALAAAETSDRVDATLTANKQSMRTTLEALLRPLGLTYRVVGADAIQVTTNEAAAERLELEFYPVGQWLAKGIEGATLAERLKARVAATTWSDVGGPGEVYFDPPSECLIVLQSQPAQVAIGRLLRTKVGGETENGIHHGGTENTEEGTKEEGTTDEHGLTQINSEKTAVQSSLSVFIRVHLWFSSFFSPSAFSVPPW